MEEEIDNGIALLEGILQNWKNENKGKEYYIFFPRCVKENGKNIVLFPIFEEGKNNTVKLKVWGKYCLETYTLESMGKILLRNIYFRRIFRCYKCGSIK